MKFNLRKPNFNNIRGSTSSLVILSFVISVVSAVVVFIALCAVVSPWLLLLIPFSAISYTIYNLFKE